MIEVLGALRDFSRVNLSIRIYFNTLFSPVFKAPPAKAIADMSTIRAYRFVGSGDTHMNSVVTRQDSDITQSLLNLSYSHPPTMFPVKYPTDSDVKIYDIFSSLLFV